MPTYEYQCDSCGKKMEASQKMSDLPLKECPACGQSTLRRGPGGGIGLAFKGEGFYINDYKSENKSQSAGECCPCGKNKSSCKSSD